MEAALPEANSLNQRSPRAMSLSSEGSGRAGGGFSASITSRNSTPRRFISSAMKRVIVKDAASRLSVSPASSVPQIQRHSDSAALQLNSIDQIAEVVGEFRAVRELFAVGVCCI